MNSKPIIAINADFRPQKQDSFPFSWIHSGYYDSVIGAGGIPMLLPPLADDDDLRRILENVDGVVLTGCKLDLDAIRMGFDTHASARPMPARREDFDRRLANLAFEMRLPTLAIGSGMQLMNVICGGTLYQHISEDILKPMHHRDPVEDRLRHIIEIVPGSRLDSIYGPGEVRVNSDHHMAVNNLASIFRASATCPDGVIEAYESTIEDWFCLGVQYHPECHTASALDMQVFESLTDACREQEVPATIPMHSRRAA